MRPEQTLQHSRVGQHLRNVKSFARQSVTVETVAYIRRQSGPASNWQVPVTRPTWNARDLDQTLSDQEAPAGLQQGTSDIKPASKISCLVPAEDESDALLLARTLFDAKARLNQEFYFPVLG